MRNERSTTKRVVGIAAVGITAIALFSGTAVAASQNTSRDIKDGAAHRVDHSAGVHRGHNESHVVYVKRFGSLVAPYPGDEAGLQMTGEGAQFGPFANGGGCDNPGTDYARLVFHGLDGKPLSAIHQLDYSGITQSDDNTSGVGSLSMRIVTDEPGTGGYDFNKFVFSPNTQPGADQNADTRGVVKTYLTTFGFWRLNDDAGVAPDSPWTTIIQSHETEKITKVDVLLGCEAGTDLRGVVRSFQANGTSYVLGKIG